MAALRRSQLDIGNSAQAAVEGVLLGLFEPDMYKTENKEERRIDELVLVAAAAGSEKELAQVSRGGASSAKRSTLLASFLTSQARR